MRAIALTAALVAASLLTRLSAVLAQPMPIGPQFQVNSDTMSLEDDSAVASDGAGNFVVVWYASGAIRGQRYDPNGAPLGEFAVNSFGFGTDPAVAADSTGNFVVAWSGSSPGSDSSGYSIQAQLFDATGAPVGGQFQVNTYTTNEQRRPALAVDAAGNFIVVWDSDGSAGSDASGYSVQGQRYDSNGMAVGAEFQVNSYTTNYQLAAAVAAAPSGSFLVTWNSDGSVGSDTLGYSVQGQLFDASGSPVGSQFQVNSFTGNEQGGAAVAATAAGDFVVVWTSYGSAGSDSYGRSIQAQRYDGSGAAQGGQFQVNTYTTGFQNVAAVATDASGAFVVTWHTDRGAGTDKLGSVQGQRYDAAAAPLGDQFQVNTYVTGGQGYASVGADSAGNFLVTWTSGGSVGPDSSLSIQGQRFSPVGLIPGVSVAVRPGQVARFSAKPERRARVTLPAADPAVTGATLRIFDTGSAAGDVTFNLPPSGWSGIGAGPGSKGHWYRGAGSLTDPCRSVFVKAGVIKAVCRGAAVTLAPPFAGDVGVVLSIGGAERYCAVFGGTEIRNDASGTSRKNAPVPAACP